MLSQMPCRPQLSKADMLLFICSEAEDKINSYGFSTRKPLLSHIFDQFLFPKQWQGSHACALWSSVYDNKHSVQHEAESGVYLQHWLWYYENLVGVNWHGKLLHWFICKSFRYICPIYAVVTVFARPITTNISGNNVGRRLVIIIFIFYHILWLLCYHERR